MTLTVSPKKTESSHTAKSRETEENAKSKTRRCILHNAKFDKEARVTEYTEVLWNKVKDAK